MTIQMKDNEQYFPMAVFVFQYFTKRNFGVFMNYDYGRRVGLNRFTIEMRGTNA